MSNVIEKAIEWAVDIATAGVEGGEIGRAHV